MLRKLLILTFTIFFPILLVFNVVRFTTLSVGVFGYTEIFSSLSQFSGESYSYTLSLLDLLKYALNSLTSWNTNEGNIIGILLSDTSLVPIPFIGDIFFVLYNIARAIIAISILIVDIMLLVSTFVTESLPLFIYFISLISIAFSANLNSLLGQVTSANMNYQDYSSWYSSFFSLSY